MNVSDLKVFDLLHEFDDHDRASLAELLEESSVATGRRIFSEGNESDGLVFVTSGTIKLANSRTSSFEILEGGCSLGALSLVSVGPREATAYAETPCEVLLLSRNAYRRLVEDYPRSACRLLEAILDELAGNVRLGLDRLAS
jgi:CRP-like cAMP-binding protein